MRILSEIMLKTRARCPCCGTRLNENALDREIDLTDERDVMEQEIGGYGGISSGSTSSFENYPEIAQYFLENVNLAKEYLEEILEIEDEETDEDE
jgi:hypothetical protein